MTDSRCIGGKFNTFIVDVLLHASYPGIFDSSVTTVDIEERVIESHATAHEQNCCSSTTEEVSGIASEGYSSSASLLGRGQGLLQLSPCFLWILTHGYSWPDRSEWIGSLSAKGWDGELVLNGG